MSVDRKTLKKRLQAARLEAREQCKAIKYPLPELDGPDGNAFSLLGQASALMKKDGVSESVRTEFHREATSGDYEHVLETISDWFTVVIPTTVYEDLGDRKIRDVCPKTTSHIDSDDLSEFEGDESDE